MTTTQQIRTVKKIMKRPSPHWVGDGFHVYPVFNHAAFTKEVSPFLMFDYAAPKEFEPRLYKQPLGVGEHPHRGFETVTVAFQGEVQHHDSTGQTGIIKEGDVQWMTAGRGIIHQEYHSKDFTNKGGIFEMCQLWVNLPKEHKMTKPGYQPIEKNDIPVVNLPLDNSNQQEFIGTARIISGELGEVKGPAKTFSPVQMWDVQIPKADTDVTLPFPSDQNCIVFVRRGSIEFLDNQDDSMITTKLNPQDLALMKMDGKELLQFHTLTPDTSVLVLGGTPINEPIAHYGPFVMNTQEELAEAFFDYQMGNFGN